EFRPFLRSKVHSNETGNQIETVAYADFPPFKVKVEPNTGRGFFSLHCTLPPHPFRLNLVPINRSQRKLVCVSVSNQTREFTNTGSGGRHHRDGLQSPTGKVSGRMSMMMMPILGKDDADAFG